MYFSLRMLPSSVSSSAPPLPPRPPPRERPSAGGIWVEPSNVTVSFKKRKKSCSMPGCYQNARKFGLCLFHGGGLKCEHPSCTTYVEVPPSGATERERFCADHGGGESCAVPWCSAKARPGSDACKEHGGKRRCLYPCCRSKCLESSLFCEKHKAVKKCLVPTCQGGALVPNLICEKHQNMKLRELPLDSQAKEEVLDGAARARIFEIALTSLAKFGMDEFGFEEQRAILLNMPVGAATMEKEGEKLSAYYCVERGEEGNKKMSPLTLGLLPPKSPSDGKPEQSAYLVLDSLREEDAQEVINTKITNLDNLDAISIATREEKDGTKSFNCAQALELDSLALLFPRESTEPRRKKRRLPARSLRAEDIKGAYEEGDDIVVPLKPGFNLLPEGTLGPALQASKLFVAPPLETWGFPESIAEWINNLTVARLKILKSVPQPTRPRSPPAVSRVRIEYCDLSDIKALLEPLRARPDPVRDLGVVPMSYPPDK